MNHDLLPQNKALQPISSPALALLPSVDLTPQGLLDTFLSKGRNHWTRRAYAKDLNDFRAFTQTESLVRTVALLLSLEAGKANAITQSYKNHMRERLLSAATCNRRLSTLASLVKLAAKVGLLAYQLQPERLPRAPYRDTKGPGKEGVQLLINELLERGDDKKQKRDIALIRLLFDLALRQNEALSLDMEHLNMRQRTISILGKGHTERETLKLPDQTFDALQDWLLVRGDKDGPVFVSLDYSSPGHRLTGSAIHKMISKLGKKVGLQVRPHGLRHAAITAALDATGGNVRAVQKFSRHKDLNVLVVYDDNRKDLGGEIAQMVAKFTSHAAVSSRVP